MNGDPYIRHGIQRVPRQNDNPSTDPMDYLDIPSFEDIDPDFESLLESFTEWSNAL